MSGLDKMIDKFIKKVFEDKKKISRKEYIYRSCSVFRVDKSLAKEVLKDLEEMGYVTNKRENVEVNKRNDVNDNLERI